MQSTHRATRMVPMCLYIPKAPPISPLGFFGSSIACRSADFTRRSGAGRGDHAKNTTLLIFYLCINFSRRPNMRLSLDSF